MQRVQSSVNDTVLDNLQVESILKAQRGFVILFVSNPSKIKPSRGGCSLFRIAEVDYLHLRGQMESTVDSMLGPQSYRAK